MKCLREKWGAPCWSISRNSPEHDPTNCVILNHNETADLDGTQSNYISAPRLPAVFSDSHCVRSLPVGAGGAGGGGAFGWDRRVAGAAAKSAFVTRRSSGSYCGQITFVFFIRNFGVQEKDCVVADDHGVE